MRIKEFIASLLALGNTPLLGVDQDVYFFDYDFDSHGLGIIKCDFGNEKNHSITCNELAKKLKALDCSSLGASSSANVYTAKRDCVRGVMIKNLSVYHHVQLGKVVAEIDFYLHRS